MNGTQTQDSNEYSWGVNLLFYLYRLTGSQSSGSDNKTYELSFLCLIVMYRMFHKSLYEQTLLIFLKYNFYH